MPRKNEIVYRRSKSPARKQREKDVLNYIRKRRRDGLLAPSHREIMQATGISSTSMVKATLDDLEMEGYITRQTNIARSIQLVGTTSDMIATLADILEPLVSMDNLIPEWRQSELRQFKSHLDEIWLRVNQTRLTDGNHDELIYTLKTVIDRLAHLCEDKLTERALYAT